ncbi:MAG: basic amino acid ABC transporter substrate-binding protein [Victivallales bacterium]|nr:basic amino acid ABC transporter substrate-binding protein [Victivallales bacterium]
MKKMTSFAFLLSILMSLTLISCGPTEKDTGAADVGIPRHVKKLVMATNAEFPPFEFKAEDGSFQGIDIEIMQAICKATGRELVVEDIAFDSIIPAVNSGKADCGVAGMTVTEDRLRNIDFTTPYYEAFQVIVVVKGSTIQGTDDLKGKRIGVQTGTTGDTLASDIEGADMNRFSKGVDAIVALTQNKVDAVVIDNEPAKAFVAKNADKLVILEEPLTKESYAMAVKKGNDELLALLNKQIERIKTDGTLDVIRAKYEGTADAAAE